MSVAIFAFALLAQALPAPASVQWEAVEEGDTTYDFIDPGTIVREGDIVSYTSRLTIVIPGDDGIALMVLRHARNCRTHQQGFRAADAYNAEGRLLMSRQTRPADIVYQPDTPGTRINLVHRRVCGDAAN